MLKEKSKFIIATNMPGIKDNPGLERNVIDPIAEYYGGVEPIVLYRPTAQQVAEQTYEIAEQGKVPMLLPMGGDGTINWHLGNMDEYSQRTALTPFPGGTANDISTTINGNTSMGTVLAHGHLREVLPLKIDYDDDSRYALGYIGLGLTGDSAKLINSSKSMKPSKLKDALVILKAVKKSRKMQLLDEEGMLLDAREIAAVNTRMASCLWLHKRRLGFFEDYFDLVKSGGYVSTAKLATAGLARRIKGARINKGQVVRLTKPDDGVSINAQTDGEHFTINRGEIAIRKSNIPIKIFSLNAIRSRLAS